MTRTWARRVATVGGVGCLLLTTAVPAQGSPDRAQRGEFQPLAGAAAHVPGVSGRAQLVRTGGGATHLSVHVRGLEPGETYGVHLHNAPCSAANPGGGHYQNVEGGLAAPPNELWASSSKRDPKAGVTADRKGRAKGSGKAAWTARSSARSVVIHIGFSHGGMPGGGTKVACADLG